MNTYQKETISPDREKPQITPVQPSVDPQEDRREQTPTREIPDIEHDHETKLPGNPGQGGQQIKKIRIN